MVDDKDVIKIPIYFYKARVSDFITNYSAYDMLHISFSERDKIKTQRFSVPGLPCIYLGTSSYVCWLELNKPSDEKFNVYAFKVDENFRVFNLALLSRYNGESKLSNMCEKLVVNGSIPNSV